jgi:isopenicillin-N N-acyltransferase-like protein
MIKKHILKGTPKEVGEQHGKLGRLQVQQSLTTYEKLFYGYQKKTWKEAREAAQVHIKAIKAYDQQLLEEMEGVAKGAGVDFEDILALNARTEIALGSYKKNFSDGCTLFATMPPVGTDTIMSQNWDWKGTQTESLLLLEMHIKDKPVVTMVTEGGMIGKIGYNSSGLGLCFNALLTDKKSDEVPIHLALRGILNSHTLSEAISRVKDGQTAASASVLIGQAGEDGSGLAINAEVSPFGMDLVGGDDGYLAHTNHILSESLKKNLLDTNEYRLDDSTMRYKRAIQLVKTAIARNETMDIQTHKKWLSDTFNAPNSINHYCNPKAEEHRQSETVFSIVMNLTKRESQLYVGKPTDGAFFTI